MWWCGGIKGSAKSAEMGGGKKRVKKAQGSVVRRRKMRGGEKSAGKSAGERRAGKEQAKKCGARDEKSAGQSPKVCYLRGIS